mmetsp:Transcript_13186/g.28441  ORF Transcript_13186/g.28441 Transcript_13186/m.28441 type:complete len:303 (-) Transcript_13186:1954-2862(-)
MCASLTRVYVRVRSHQGAARRELMHIRRDVDTNAVKHPHVCPRDPCAVAIELVAMKICSGAAHVLEKNIFYTMEVVGLVHVEDRLVRQHHLLDHLKDALVVGDRQGRPPCVDAHQGAMDAGSEDEVDLLQLTPPRLDVVEIAHLGVLDRHFVLVTRSAYRVVVVQGLHHDERLRKVAADADEQLEQVGRGGVRQQHCNLQLGCLVIGRVSQCMELLLERRAEARIRVEHEARTAQRDCFASFVHIRDLRGKATAHGVAVWRALLESIEERVLLIVQHDARRRDRCGWLLSDIRWTSCTVGQE